LRFIRRSSQIAFTDRVLTFSFQFIEPEELTRLHRQHSLQPGRLHRRFLILKCLLRQDLVPIDFRRPEGYLLIFDGAHDLESPLEHNQYVFNVAVILDDDFVVLVVFDPHCFLNFTLLIQV
jgi:hypothetical protein